MVGRTRCTGGWSAICLALCIFRLALLSSASADVIFVGEVDPTIPSNWKSSIDGYIGRFSGKVGSAVVDGGSGLSSRYGYLGYSSGSSGTATVTGIGSKWTNSSDLYVGRSGTGTLTVENGGQVTAASLSVNTSTSAVNLYVSGSDMLILGTATTAGSASNYGKINFDADAFLSPGSYTPISELKGRTMSWSGSGSYNAVGGTWDNSSKQFLVAAAAEFPAGATVTLTTGARAIITDADSGERVGVSVGTIAGTPTFSASLLTPADLAGISLGPGESVRSAWTFSTDLTGTTLLSFDVGAGLSDLHAWRYANNTWTAYDTHIVYRDDTASFTVTGFSAYAVTVVPEPGTPVLLAIGLAALGLYWRGRRRRG